MIPRRGIVFDLDGTLIDSLNVTFEAFNQSFVRFGAKAMTGDEIMTYFGPGEKEIFKTVVGPENAKAAYDLAKNHLQENLAKVPLHKGVGELLEQLKSSGVPISIFTGRSWDTTQLILTSHGLLDRFITVVAFDHVSSGKPSPEGLKLALSRMKVEPEHAFMVGDHHADILAARGAGSPSIAAIWDPMVKRSALELHRPNHWAEMPAKIWEIWASVE